MSSKDPWQDLRPCWSWAQSQLQVQVQELAAVTDQIQLGRGQQAKEMAEIKEDVQQISSDMTHKVEEEQVQQFASYLVHNHEQLQMEVVQTINKESSSVANNSAAVVNNSKNCFSSSLTLPKQSKFASAPKD